MITKPLAVGTFLFAMLSVTSVYASGCEHCRELRRDYNHRIECARHDHETACRNLRDHWHANRSRLLDEIHHTATCRHPGRHVTLRRLHEELVCLDRDYHAARRDLNRAFAERNRCLIRDREAALRACREMHHGVARIRMHNRVVVPARAAVPHGVHSHGAGRAIVPDPDVYRRNDLGRADSWRTDEYRYGDRRPDMVRRESVDVGGLILGLIARHLDR